MIYKVFYQQSQMESPKREGTETLFIQADSIAQVREHLTSTTPYMIEHIAEVSDAMLEYERTHREDFHIEEL